MTSTGDALDGDQILAILALASDVDLVAVTVMTNLGFHRLMAEHEIRVVTTPVGDRYVVEALRAEGGVLGGEQSGHVIWLRDHVSGDGLAAALLLCGALGGRDAERGCRRDDPLSAGEGERARVPPSSRRRPSRAIHDEVERVNAKLGENGRVLVRSSGTERVVRVLAEARRRRKRRTFLCYHRRARCQGARLSPTKGARRALTRS